MVATPEPPPVEEVEELLDEIDEALRELHPDPEHAEPDAGGEQQAAGQGDDVG